MRRVGFVGVVGVALIGHSAIAAGCYEGDPGYGLPPLVPSQPDGIVEVATDSGVDSGSKALPARGGSTTHGVR